MKKNYFCKEKVYFQTSLVENSFNPIPQIHYVAIEKIIHVYIFLHD